MDLIELENHPLARAVPLKMPVEFFVDGEIGPHLKFGRVVKMK